MLIFYVLAKPLFLVSILLVILDSGLKDGLVHAFKSASFAFSNKIDSEYLFLALVPDCDLKSGWVNGV